MMRPAMLGLPLAILFLVNAVPSIAQSDDTVAVAPASVADELIFYDVGRSNNFTLRCATPNDKNVPVLWSKNGTAISELGELKERVRYEEGGAVLALGERAQENDFGNYTCDVGGERRTLDVRGRPHAKLPANTNVVEGQKLKIQCKVIGKPYPAVWWTFSNASDPTADNGTEVTAALGSRVVLQSNEQGVENAELVLEAAAAADAGRYTCRVAGGTPAATTLRVKDMYAALWPFLGICAEVFVLCAIILVYEKRRTKPELDDSDTDNHDQKKS